MRNAQCTVCVSAYEKLIAAVLFNYRGLYRYRSRRKQRVKGLVPVPRGPQVRAFLCRVHYRICACKRQEISSGTGTCFEPSRSFSCNCKRALRNGKIRIQKHSLLHYNGSIWWPAYFRFVRRGCDRKPP